MAQSDSPAVLNPAYYPYWRKPELLWNDKDREQKETDDEAGGQPEAAYGTRWL